MPARRAAAWKSGAGGSGCRPSTTGGRREVAVHIEEGRPGDVAVAPQALARAGLAQPKAAVHHAQARRAEALPQPGDVTKGPLVHVGLAYGHEGDGAPRGGRAASRGGAAAPGTGGRRGAARGRGLRGLPDRPAHPRRRARRSPAAARARPPDRGHGGGGGRDSRARRAGRGALARLDRRNLWLLPQRTGEPLRQRGVHRLRPRRRLRAARGGRRAILPSAPGRLPRPPGRAASVRGADRLPHPEAGGGRRADRDLRLRFRGPHHLPGGRTRGPSRVRLHPARRRRASGLRPKPRSRMGG